MSVLMLKILSASEHHHNPRIYPPACLFVLHHGQALEATTLPFFLTQGMILCKLLSHPSTNHLHPTQIWRLTRVSSIKTSIMELYTNFILRIITGKKSYMESQSRKNINYFINPQLSLQDLSMMQTHACQPEHLQVETHKNASIFSTRLTRQYNNDKPLDPHQVFLA